MRKMFLQKKETDNGKILIVESQAQNRILLREILGREYDIFIADNKAAAVTATQETNPDLIILNAKLSGEKTLDLCARLKNDAKTKAVPILIIAETNDDSNVAEYYAQNIEGYLIKPFESQELLNQVRLSMRKGDQKGI